MRDWIAKVCALADRQAGRVAWWQLIALEVDRKTIVRWTDGGLLFKVLPRVYAVGHRAPSLEADLWAAVLYAGPGAMLSHTTALWWHGLLDTKPWPLQVTTPRRCRSLKGIRVYGRRTCERNLQKRPPTTSVEQALLDLAATAPLDRVRYALANADYHKVLDIPALQAIAGSGRTGSTKLKKALERHEPKLARTRSPLERLFLPLCERIGIPLPRSQRLHRGCARRRRVARPQARRRTRWREQPQLVEPDPKRPKQGADPAEGCVRRRSLRHAPAREEAALVEADVWRAYHLPR